MTQDRVRFSVDSPFTKAAESPSGDLKLLGYASTWTLDRDNEYVDKKAFDSSLDKYLSKNPILLWQHDLEKPFGTVEHASVDRYGLNVRANVPKPESGEPDWAHLAYNKVKAGVVKTFSIGGFFEREVRNLKRVISNVDLFEISVVSVPSNPDSIFAAAVKALEGSIRPELLPTHVAQMKQLLGMEAVSDPDLAGMGDDEKKQRYDEIATIYRKVGKLPPGYDSFRELEAEFSGAEVDPLERLAKLTPLVKAVQGHENAPAEAKAGRILSRANEARLRQALESLQEVLTLVQESADETEEIDPESFEAPATTITRSTGSETK